MTNELVPGMTFAMEPNYVYGQHLAYLGDTVIVGNPDPIELNPYTAQILPAEGNNTAQPHNHGALTAPKN